jgi:pSer/pThr/pTyr-binding forkhead associated (FHA) protein
MQPGSDALAGTTARLDDMVADADSGPHFVVKGTGATICLPRVAELVIGRSDPHTTLLPDVDLGLHGGGQAGVSRSHARLLHGPEGWLLEDLGSTNGTYVNEMQLTPGQIVHIRTNDTVRCGQLQLVFYEE